MALPRGYKFSEKSKKKISLAVTGLKKPKEAIRKGVETRRIKNNYRKKGEFKHTEKTKNKMRGKRPNFIPWNYIDGRSKNVSPARYGDDWFKIRILIYKRDNFTCQECRLKMCKETGAFHIHHKIPFLISFDNSLNNLITLCPSCHRKIDAELMRQIKFGGKDYEQTIKPFRKVQDF